MPPADSTSRKFHFIREIASGGFGSVFLAKVIHPDGFSRLAAIKLLHPKWSENEEIASRMRDEARLLGQLRHRNIVDVMDLTLIDGRVAVIMEYLEAVDLRTVLQDCVRHGELLPTRVVLEIGLCSASALDAAFNRPPIPGEKPLRVIHRDIKPSNIMVDEGGTAKVLDFGVARADFEERESHTQDVAFGSIDYMPPERLFFEPESPASDVYSLGATLFELLALEKFGKAKLRPDEHEELIFKRLRYLFGRHPVGDGAVRNEVKALLTDMLAFDESDRPTAADSYQRLRSIARTIRDDESLPEWAEHAIPPLLDAKRAREVDRDPNPLVDQVLEEDSKGFERTPTDELLGGPGEPPDDEVGLDSPPPEDDARWSALKEATLAEIQAASEPPAPPRSLESISPAEAETEPGSAPPIPAERPPRPRSRPPAPSEPGAARYLAAAVGLLLVVGLVSATGLVLGAYAVASGAVDPRPLITPISARSAQAEPPAPEPAPAVAPALPEGPRVTFVSRLADTTKMTARCDGDRAEGGDRVVLGAEGLGDCTVTGFGPDRTRLTAVVKGVEEGTWVCFEDGAKTCRPGSSDG